MNWSSQQERALKEVDEWLKDATAPQVFYLAGFAGTGKTTLAMYFGQQVSGLVLYAAFTGKAASVLRRKGCPTARTLHSILYSVADGESEKLRKINEKLVDLRFRLWDMTVEADGQEAIHAIENEIDKLEEAAKQERKKRAKPSFHLNLDSDMREASLLILDECSMIDERLAKDVLSFGKKVLVIGDPAQLPPVYGTGYFTRKEPDILLTEIHRQANDNPILRAATALREHRRIPYGDWGNVRHIPRREIDGHSFATESYKRGSQILTGKNDTRRAINRAVRYYLGYREPMPMKDEALVVLRNDHELGVLNGVVCKAASAAEKDVDDDAYMIELMYEGGLLPWTPLDPIPFRAYNDPKLEPEIGANRYLLQCDWGYALTVHKSQGSEWEDITLWDDGFGRGDLRWQWLYTAVTRASERVTIVSGPIS